MLSVVSDMDNIVDCHQCELCEAPININEAELLLVLDEMTSTDMNTHISLDERMAIFYIAGYVSCKHKQLSGSASNVPPEFQCPK